MCVSGTTGCPAGLETIFAGQKKAADAILGVGEGGSTDAAAVAARAVAVVCAPFQRALSFKEIVPEPVEPDWERRAYVFTVVGNGGSHAKTCSSHCLLFNDPVDEDAARALVDRLSRTPGVWRVKVAARLHDRPKRDALFGDWSKCRGLRLDEPRQILTSDHLGDYGLEDPARLFVLLSKDCTTETAASLNDAWRDARAAKGGFNVTSTRVFSDKFCQKKHLPYENLRRDDHPSKNELKRVETDRDMSLES